MMDFKAVNIRQDRADHWQDEPAVAASVDPSLDEQIRALRAEVRQLRRRFAKSGAESEQLAAMIGDLIGERLEHQRAQLAKEYDSRLEQSQALLREQRLAAAHSENELVGRINQLTRDVAEVRRSLESLRE